MGRFYRRLQGQEHPDRTIPNRATKRREIAFSKERKLPKTQKSEPLPEPWQSTITGQSFHPVDRWHKPGVELIDWFTYCRICGADHTFTLRADYPGRIATKVSLRWHSSCRGCHRGAGA